MCETLNISVVIRTRNTEKCFDTLVKNLSLQTIQASEIVVVNNYSSEEKLRTFENNLCGIVRKCFRYRKIKLKLATLSDNDFSHAYSTNLGVGVAENELVCVTNAHSLPISFRWLQDGIKHFEDPSVAGVSGFFIPSRDGSVLGKFDAVIYYLSQAMILHQNRFSTINCMIRKSLWEKYPFDEKLPKIIPETKIYGLEDYDWSKEMMARGFRIIIDPLFSVFHSHHKSLNEMLRNVRNFFIYRKIQQKINLFDRPRESFSKVIQARNIALSAKVT